MIIGVSERGGESRQIEILRMDIPTVQLFTELALGDSIHKTSIGWLQNNLCCARKFLECGSDR